MEWIILIIILIGLAKIDSTPWKILKSLDTHHQKAVALLAETRDTCASK